MAFQGAGKVAISLQFDQVLIHSECRTFTCNSVCTLWYFKGSDTYLKVKDRLNSGLQAGFHKY